MRRTPLYVWHLAAAAALLAPAALRAEEVRVTVMAIHATDKNKDVDEELKDLAEKVQKAEPSLTGFRKGSVTAMSMTEGAKAAFPLVGTEVVAVTVDGFDKNNKPKLTVKPPAQGAITYSIVYDKFFPIVTRYETPNKERLIVAIMVEQAKK